MHTADLLGLLLVIVGVWAALAAMLALAFVALTHRWQTRLEARDDAIDRGADVLGHADNVRPD